jgi:diguanylate cyclase (GGDEF)-like protein
MMLTAIATAVALAAVLLLAAALAPTWRLLREVPTGPARTAWRLLGAVNALLLLGWIAYLALHWGWQADPFELIVATISLCAAAYVFIAARQALGTALRVRGISSADREAVSAALAGTAGKGGIEKALREQLLRARRHGLALSVLLIDIDDFGSINREFGHEAGDRVLAEVGRIVGESLRGSDVTLRYAGEELTAILPHTPPRAAYTAAERLRGAIGAGARQALRDVLGARRAITVSVGVAGLEGGESLEGDLLALAAQALGKAKAAGYNRVELAAAPSESKPRG